MSEPQRPPIKDWQTACIPWDIKSAMNRLLEAIQWIEHVEAQNTMLRSKLEKADIDAGTK